MMKIKLIAVGKTDNSHIQACMDEYIKRLGFYVSFEMLIIPDIRNSKSLSEEQQKTKEAEAILKNIDSSDVVVLLDEKGKNYTSEGFSEALQKKMNSGIKNLVFIIGGPYGFSNQLYLRANEKLSLSAMTFSHQMVRLFFVEQVYRAFTIIKNEPYHHR